MKKLSLKALGATLLAVGLTLAGVVAPAHAIGTGTVTWTSGSAPSVTSSTTSLPALGLSFVPSSGNSQTPFSYIDIALLDSSNASAGTNMIGGAQSTALGCKMTTAGLGAISGTHVTNNSFSCQSTVAGVRYNIGAGSYGGFTITLDSGLFAFLTPGSYNIKVSAGVVDEALIPLVIPAAPAVTASPATFSGTQQVAISQTIAYSPSNMSGPYTYSSVNSLGIIVNNATGALSGTPIASTNGQAQPLTITVSGANGQTATVTIMVTIASANLTPPPPSGNGSGCANGAGVYLFTTDGNAGSTNSSATYCRYYSSTTSGALPANNFVRVGFTFTGWNTSSNGTGTSYQPGDSFIITRNSTMFGTTQSFFAQWVATAQSGASNNNTPPSRPSASLGLTVSRGARIANAPVPVASSGLLPNAPFTVEVHSTPVVIASGTVASDGTVNYTAAIPSGLEAGWHTLIFTSTAADGSSFSTSYYFQVGSDGTLLATTDTVPVELSYTGLNAAPYLASGVLLALAGAVLLLIARRRKTI
jgi:hypothetical protein